MAALLATALGEIPKVGSFTYIGAAAGGVSGWLTAWVLLAPAAGLVGLRLIRARWKRAGCAPDQAADTAPRPPR